MNEGITYEEAVTLAEKRVGQPWFPGHEELRSIFIYAVEDEFGPCTDPHALVPQEAVKVIEKCMREAWATMPKHPSKAISVGRISTKEDTRKDSENISLSEGSLSFMPGRSIEMPYGKEWFIRSLLIAKKVENYALEWRKKHLNTENPLTLDEAISWLKTKSEQLNKLSYTVTIEAALSKSELDQIRCISPQKSKEAIPFQIGSTKKTYLFSKEVSTELIKRWASQYKIKISWIKQEVIPINIGKEAFSIYWIAVGNEPSLLSLQKVTYNLANKTGWKLDQAARFVLLGLVPLIRPIEAVAGFPRSDQRNFINLKIDSLAQPNLVKYEYEQQRAGDWKGKRGFDEATLDLVYISLKKGSWIKKRKEWLKKYPEKKGVSIESLRSMCSRARKQLESTLPPFWRKRYKKWADAQRPKDLPKS